MLGRRGGSLSGISLVALVALTGGCSTNGPVSADDTVYLDGNVYDGAVGTPLTMKLTSVAIEYRDTPLKVTIDAAGRFVTQDPLPTWQDYVVTIVADGYRPFVSHNPGFEVPASLAGMTSGLSTISTVQSFSFDSYLFPIDLMAPAVSFQIATVDELPEAQPKVDSIGRTLETLGFTADNSTPAVTAADSTPPVRW